MEPDTKVVLSQCTFRAAAFWRLLHQVWSLTKNYCPEAFPIGSLVDRDWDKEPKHIETLVSMIFEMNCGTSARCGFLTIDEDVLADAVIMVVRAFTSMPELLPKLETLFLITKAGSSFVGPKGLMNSYIKTRLEEMMNLAKDFYTMANVIENKDVRVLAKLTNDLPDTNFYLQLSVYES
jgi:hypothetical protein